MTTATEIDRKITDYKTRLAALESSVATTKERHAQAAQAAAAFEDDGTLSAEAFIRERNRLNEVRDIAEVEASRAPGKIQSLHSSVYFELKEIADALIEPLKKKAEKAREEIEAYVRGLFKNPDHAHKHLRQFGEVWNLISDADAVRGPTAVLGAFEHIRKSSARHNAGTNEGYAHSIKEAIALL